MSPILFGYFKIKSIKNFVGVIVISVYIYVHFWCFSSCLCDPQFHQCLFSLCLSFAV